MKGGSFQESVGQDGSKRKEWETRPFFPGFLQPTRSIMVRLIDSNIDNERITRLEHAPHRVAKARHDTEIGKARVRGTILQSSAWIESSGMRHVF